MSPAPTEVAAAVEGVSKRFSVAPDLAERLAIRAGLAAPPAIVRALDGVSLEVQRGEVLGIVGESGCGKSTLGRVMAGMLTPSEGRVTRAGRDLASLRGAEARRVRLATQIIFQDPMSSLNPRHRVGRIIGEAPRVHGLTPRAEIPALVARMLGLVGLDPAMADRFPHQFSGGQRQRIGIARALAVSPDLLICDESIAALDVSVQAQVINLLMELRRELGLTIVFISHDLGVVRHLADRVVVMYLGRVVEAAPAEALFAAPRHPYAAALLDEIPRIDRRGRRFAAISGEIPSPVNPPPGCHFHPRCPHAHHRCRAERPALAAAGPEREVACHLNGGRGLEPSPQGD